MVRSLVLQVQSLDDIVVLECYECDHKGTDKTTSAGRAKDDTLGVASLTVRELIAAEVHRLYTMWPLEVLPPGPWRYAMLIRNDHF